MTAIPLRAVTHEMLLVRRWRSSTVLQLRLPELTITILTALASQSRLERLLLVLRHPLVTGILLQLSSTHRLGVGDLYLEAHG
jgi:hypothetical protein